MNIYESILLVAFITIILYVGIICLTRSAGGNDRAREQIAREQEQLAEE